MRNLFKRLSQSIKDAGLNWFTATALVILLIVLAGYTIYYLIGLIGAIYWLTHSILLTVIIGIIVIDLVCTILYS